jgi:peptidoglycan-N-acetylglucosamine deacetylase
LIAEIRRTDELLEAVLGRGTNLFRPPYGKLTASKLGHLWCAGQSVVLWNVDPKDHARRSSSELHEAIGRRPPRGGDLILFHDSHPHARVVVPDLVKAARAQGLTFVAVDAWL